MGSCISTNYRDESSFQLTAKVITLDGSLREYSVTLTASQVVDTETSSSSSPCFLCNSDKLYYDEFIQPLGPKEEIQLGQIYFILPTNRLQFPLSAPDMAAMAVKASSAFLTPSTKGSRGGGGRKKIRISPDLETIQNENQRYGFDELKKLEKSAPVGITRSSSVRKLQRSASRRAKLAIRSFRMRLSTIHEGVAD